MTVHTEWVRARTAFVRYGQHEDAFGTPTDQALLLGTDSVVAIEGSQEELLDLLARARQAIEGDEPDRRV